MKSCKICGYNTKWSKTEVGAITMWNTRPAQGVDVFELRRLVLGMIEINANAGRIDSASFMYCVDAVEMLDKILLKIPHCESDKSCPSCRDSAKAFELTNYTDVYMCDGCTLTRGSIIGKWEKIQSTLKGES